MVLCALYRDMLRYFLRDHVEMISCCWGCRQLWDSRESCMDEATGDEHYLSLVPSTVYMSSPINIQYIYTIHCIPYIYTVYSIIYRRCVAHGL